MEEKMKKRLFVLLMAIITAFTSVSALVGCKSNEENPLAEFENRPVTVSYAYCLGGYGEDHLVALAREYMTNYDQDTYIKLVPYTNGSNEREQIKSGLASGDFVSMPVDAFRISSYLEELSEFYQTTVPGESVSVKDKIGSRYDYYVENYKEGGQIKQGIFQMPTGSLDGYHFVYNKTTLDEVFGQDNYTLPRTTLEFFDFGDAMFEEGAYLSSAAVADAGGGDYLEYCYQVWFAQLLGLEEYDQFYEGKYFDAEANDWVLNKEKAEILNVYEDKIKDAYTIASTFLSCNNNYMHPATSDLDYLDNDKVFAGNGFGLDFEKTGFLFIGSWFEKEIEPLLKEGVIKPQEYGVMRVPVASSIVKYLEDSDMTDAELSAIIEAIDNGATSFDGVSEKDFAKIYQARKMAINQICSEYVIPKIKAENESKRQAIYKFAAFLMSDKAKLVVAQKLGGLSLFMGADLTPSELGFEPNRFVKEFNAIGGDSIVVDYRHINKLFPVHVPIKWYYIPGGGRLSSYCVTKSEAQSADQMFNMLYNSVNSAWKTGIAAYEAALSN